MYECNYLLTIFSRTVLWNICSLMSASSSIFTYSSVSSVTNGITREATFCLETVTSMIIINMKEQLTLFCLTISHKNTGAPTMGNKPFPTNGQHTFVPTIYLRLRCSVQQLNQVQWHCCHYIKMIHVQVPKNAEHTNCTVKIYNYSK